MSGPSLNVAFNGNTPQLRQLAIKTTLLTLVTLGIYRFWARTRIRQYFWSAIAPGGQAFEYTGKGIEKLLGFLIAVAVLAIYLGIIQLLLSFAGMSLMDAGSDVDPFRQLAVTYIVFFAVLPLIFYAQYRARRYMLSRTRWRGIRFGAEKAAWGYTARALLHTFLTIITLGILLPRQTFSLEKYKADRTWYGSGQFSQHGRWQALYPAMKHVAIGLVIMIVAGVLAGVAQMPILGIGVFVGVIWFYVGFAYYSVHSHRYLTANKTLDGGVTFSSEPLTSTVIKIFLLGGLLTGLIASVLGGVVGFILGFAIDPIVGGVIGYIVFFVVAGVCGLVLITQPMIRHYADVTTIHNAAGLDQITQREGDDMIEAEGFADALDVGAAI